MLHLPPSTIMEYKSNNGASSYALPPLLASPKTKFRRFHGRQVLLPQFHHRSYTTFMTIPIPFCCSCVCCDVLSVSMLVHTHTVYAHCWTSCKNGERNLQKIVAGIRRQQVDSNMRKAYDTHGDMIHGIGYPTAPTTTSPSPSASASPSPSASMSSSPSASAECSKYIGSRTSASASARSSASSWLGGTCATRTSAHLSRKRSIG